MKAPATTTAKNRKSAAAAGKGRVASAVKPTASKPSPAKKAPAKAPTKAASKPVAKPAPKKVAPKVATKPVAKAAVKKTVAAPVTKKAAAGKASAPAAPVKAVKTTAPKTVTSKAPAAKELPAKKPLPSVSTEASRKTSAKAVTVAAVAPAPAPAPVVIEPTPRPLGKRAAKKVMMEQMTQAAVVPTHAPDAAKATFSFPNERVMTAPAPSAIQKDPKRANNWKTVPVDKLTDQDVQAMPDSEYMNDVQLAFFRRKLSQLKDDMLANAGETTEHLREDTVVVPDPADRATIEEEHALELRTRDRERKLLKKIEQAIARIDSGDYGYCEETGEPIGVGRLMARPTASLSLEAQQRRELKQKMFGD
ncbi:RNA polymerase-binding protein DksA [Hydrogenophaga sp.]|uniref:RNA polymerase-binding protein DksA n=1 Tax=Hydrogenophaga sp. TaxID=1904254 RepID=UPI0035AF3FEA